MVQPISQNKRYIVRNGSPVLIPTNPIALIKSNFFQHNQRLLKIILEPYLWKDKRVSDDHTKKGSSLLYLIKILCISTFSIISLLIFNILLVFLLIVCSVGGFFQRHFGEEVVDYLIDPFVAGTSAGDPESLSAPLCNVKEMKITKRGTRFPLDFIPEVVYMPLSVIITTFKKENVKRPLEGFGVLVPLKSRKTA
ncbi:hypothetical protein GBA52_011763 [Prunus armeniaca]|nr:hypothetical protein GBA52_011763 [Prunus armeniaca]